ncbi:MAG: hydroxymethylbilane synthase [Nitrospirae bacterium]|nr:MAG: hydroxymethylbilane synthase [Nitrospirota bacterium]
MTPALRELVIGTRGSALAVWQAEWVLARLREVEPGIGISIKRIKTTGDKVLDTPLAMIGGKGLFVKEIEDALARGEIDLAVHSMKDVPTRLPQGMAILAMPERDNPYDVLISRRGLLLDDMPKGARIGTSSLRRQSQILRYRPDLTVVMLRGNLDTRLRKLDEGAYDGIIVAAAGLNRLGLAHRVTQSLSADICLPAIAQGALGLEGRADDDVVKMLAGRLNHEPTRITVTAERALLERLEGGCQVPIAAHATILQKRLRVEGLVASLNGARLVRDSVEGSIDAAHRLGVELAERLLALGGDAILQEIYTPS